MKNNDYPNWLVSLEIAKELKEIGFNEYCPFFVYPNDDEVFISGTVTVEEDWLDEDNYGEVIIDLSVTECGKFNKLNFQTIPTWEQVFEWFREKKIYGNVNQEWEYGRYNSPIGLNYFYVINDCRKKKINKTKAIVNGGFDNYEEAREELVIKIIQTYKNEQL